MGQAGSSPATGGSHTFSNNITTSTSSRNSRRPSSVVRRTSSKKDKRSLQSRSREISYPQSAKGASQRRPSDLVVRDKLPGESDELEGLCIRVSEGKRLSKARPRLDIVQMVDDSHGSVDSVHEKYKQAAMRRSSLGPDAMWAPPPPLPIFPTRATYYSSDIPYRSNQNVAPHVVAPSYPSRLPPLPIPLSPPQLDSRWSPSSAGESSSHAAFPAFRNSFGGSLYGNSSRAAKRVSRQSGAASPVSQHSTKSFMQGSLRLGGTKPKSKVNSINKRAIVVTGGQRLGAGKHAAIVAATDPVGIPLAGLRRGSVVPVGLERRGSFAGGRRTSVGGKTGLGKRRRSSGSDRRGSNSRPGSRKSSGAGLKPIPALDEEKLDAALSMMRPVVEEPPVVVASRDSGEWVDLSDSTPPPTPPKDCINLPASSPSSPASSDKVMVDEDTFSSNFITASPNLSDSDAPRPAAFEQMGRKLSCVPVPSLSRLPAGHPANHHARFRNAPVEIPEETASIRPPPLKLDFTPFPIQMAYPAYAGDSPLSSPSLPCSTVDLMYAGSPNGFVEEGPRGEQSVNFVPEKISPLFALPQPLPVSPSSLSAKHNLRLDFSDFKMQPGELHPRQFTRKPSIVSPTSFPVLAGFTYDPLDDYLDPLDVPTPIIYTPADEIRLSFLGGDGEEESAPFSNLAPNLPAPGTAELALRNFDFTVESPYGGPAAHFDELSPLAETPLYERVGPSYFSEEATRKRQAWAPSFDPPAIDALNLGPRRETDPAVRTLSSRTPSLHRWNRADTFDAGAETMRDFEDRMQRERQFSLIGPDASVPSRLGSASKRGFDKVEIRGWLLSSRKESVSGLSGYTIN